MKRVLCAAIAATALMLTAAQPALARPPHHHHGGPGPVFWGLAGLTGLAIATSALSHPAYAYPPYPAYAYPQYPVYAAPPAATVVVPAPAVQATPATQGYWYYCEDSKTYYPYVTSCPSGWKAVPAVPPGTTP